MRFLSPEWIDALAAAATDATVDPGVSLTVEQRVIRAGGDVHYHLLISGGQVRVAPGPAAEPDLTLTCSEKLAAAISRGEVNAQRALAEGAMRVGGRLHVLLRHGRCLTEIHDAFAAVRAETTY